MEFTGFSTFVSSSFVQDCSINFANYQNFNDATKTFDDFIQKIMFVIDKVAPIKERRIRHNSQEWFDDEISEAIKNCDKAILNIDKELYNATPYKVHRLIFNNKKNCFEKKLNECIGKPKELWKTLTSLGLPNKT